MRKVIFSYLHLLIFESVISFMIGCKPSKPSGVLSSGTMEDILFDYHVAQAMAGYDGKKMIQYETAVLKKHDVTKSEFDSSMVYYIRHTEELHEIYEHLSNRLNDEVVAMGGSSSIGQYDDVTGDTANIWKGMRSAVFSPDKPFNYEAFEVKADTSFHKNDRFLLEFDAQFLYQSGPRDGIAVLAVQFSNDSVASQVTHIQSDTHFSLMIQDGDSLGIKAVRGYFLLNRGDDSNSSSLKIMILQNIRLVRMHVKNTPVGPQQEVGTSQETPITAPSSTPLPPPSNNGPQPIPDNVKAAPVAAGIERTVIKQMK